jgi:ribosomal protein L7/L12
MSSARTCPQCNKPLASDAPQGLCPECLLKAAFPSESASESAHEAAATGNFDPSPAAAFPPYAGKRLRYFGDYELLEEIARGGMGVVWKARQTSLKRDVALKMIRAGALAGPDEVARFLREAEAAANLQHPNIVAIHEVGEHDGQHYFSMDLVIGCDLGAIAKEGPLAPQRAARYVKIIAEAIHFAHQRGTLHRDLKPQNVLIDTADQPRITDFGLAKIMKDDSQLTQSGVIMGSPSYMPPEQAAGRQADIGPASDVYSLGAMLYELLTGRPPFRGATAMATLHDVMESEPASLRRLKADIPPDLETICLKCLEKSPSARYPTARALAEELDRCLKGEPIQARPAGVVRKAVSWAMRHPGTLAALAALAIVTLSFGVFYLFEENAFLRAQQANPALARIPGWRHQFLQILSRTDLVAVFLGLCTVIAIRRRTYGLTFKEQLYTAKQFRPIQPLGERTRTFAVVAGMVMIGCAVILLLTTIQAHVWEGGSIFDVVFLIYVLVYCGLLILGMAVRDYRLVHYGMSSRQLTAEQIEPIRRALEEDFDYFTAVKYYREAAPEASLAEAKQYVTRLFKSLLVKRFGRLEGEVLALTVDPGRRIEAIAIYRAQTGVGLKEAMDAVDELAAKHSIRPKGAGRAVALLMMVVSTIIGGVILGTFFARMPANPTAYGSQFGYALLFTVALLNFRRVKGFWKRILCFVPGLAAMVFSVAILPWLTDVGPASLTPYLTGLLFGISLKAFNLGLQGILWKEEYSRRSRGERILAMFVGYLIGLSVLLLIVAVVILQMP